MMRYLPFIIISLVLYTLFFYHNQEPELLSAKEDLSAQIIKQKVIPLDLTIAEELERQAILEKQQLATMPTVKPVTEQAMSTSPSDTLLTTAVITSTAVPTETADKSLAIATKSTENNFPPIQVAKKNIEKMKYFQASIKSTAASDVALLKGEAFERDFHLDLPPPPAKKARSTTSNVANQRAITKKTKPSTAPVSNVPQQKMDNKPKQAESVKTNTSNEKQKRVFKKTATVQQSTALPGLQVAIAVSGNNPPYPQVAKEAGLQGTVSARFIVNMQGKTKNIKIISSSGHKILDEALRLFITEERFMPALEGIEKVTSEQQFSFNYQ